MYRANPQVSTSRPDTDIRAASSRCGLNSSAISSKQLASRRRNASWVSLSAVLRLPMTHPPLLCSRAINIV